jgi:uncharacterized protein YbjT (DUF2867 family)
MKIVLTGSLGHIGKPLTIELVQKGHQVTVITSKDSRQKEIEALGAIAAVGTIEDVAFLTRIFTGADAVYTMIPPPNFIDANIDMMAYINNLANNFEQAIRLSDVKRVVHLSSIGGHLASGSGLILGHHAVENILKKLTGVAITIIRPVGFYYNLLGFIPAIESTGVISANYGADDMLVWVSPIDIAAAVANELETPLVGSNVRYVASDELTGNETATILGEAIGKPDLKWILVSNEDRLKVLETFISNKQISRGLVEMFACQHEGTLMEDYYRHKPALGKIKISDFAKEFAAVYHQK